MELECDKYGQLPDDTMNFSYKMRKICPLPLIKTIYTGLRDGLGGVQSLPSITGFMADSIERSLHAVSQERDGPDYFWMFSCDHHNVGEHRGLKWGSNYYASAPMVRVSIFTTTKVALAHANCQKLPLTSRPSEVRSLIDRHLPLMYKMPSGYIALVELVQRGRLVGLGECVDYLFLSCRGVEVRKGLSDMAMSDYISISFMANVYYGSRLGPIFEGPNSDHSAYTRLGTSGLCLSDAWIWLHMSTHINYYHFDVQNSTFRRDGRLYNRSVYYHSPVADMLKSHGYLHACDPNAKASIAAILSSLRRLGDVAKQVIEYLVCSRELQDFHSMRISAQSGEGSRLCNGLSYHIVLRDLRVSPESYDVSDDVFWHPVGLGNVHLTPLPETIPSDFINNDTKIADLTEEIIHERGRYNYHSFETCDTWMSPAGDTLHTIANPNINYDGSYVPCDKRIPFGRVCILGMVADAYISQPSLKVHPIDIGIVVREVELEGSVSPGSFEGVCCACDRCLDNDDIDRLEESPEPLEHVDSDFHFESSSVRQCRCNRCHVNPELDHEVVNTFYHANDPIRYEDSGYDSDEHTGSTIWETESEEGFDSV